MTTTSLMASAICTPSCSFTCRRISLSASSSSSISVPQVQFVKWIRFSSWNGLKQLCISKSYYSQQIGRSKKQKGKGVYASLFGVGAPEALVIGVVALLVFGPKGLAEVARNLGKTLRAFQPTIRELQDVSREFKSTLEREIGLDDIKGSDQDTFRSSTTTTTVSPSSDAGSKDSKAEVDPDGSPTPSSVSTREDEMEKLMRIAAAEKQAERDMASLTESQPEPQNESQDTSSSTERAYSSEDLLKITEQQLKAAAQQQSETTSPQQSPSNTQSKSHDTIQEAASVIPSSHKAENEA